MSLVCLSSGKCLRAFLCIIFKEASFWDDSHADQFDAVCGVWSEHWQADPPLGPGDMAQKIITIIIFISVDIDNYHDKCQIFISFKFKARFLLQSESFRNQTINFP